jgi:Flp pilus assembly protein TadB
MPESTAVFGSILAGVLCAGAVLVGHEGLTHDAAGWLQLNRARLNTVLHVSVARHRLARALERAGWRGTPERVAICAAAIALSLGVVGAAVSPTLSVLGLLGGGAAFAVTLNSAIHQRRRRLSGELVPLLELFTLELSGGGSALAALGSVCLQVESELAIDLRRMLIASQVAGSSSFESRLLEYSDRHEIPSLGSLATILAASRDYGTGASQGVRALATDLRRAQRRELIAQSRRALNNVLLPAAVAVLLPFLGILMFPAVSVLQRSLR